MRYAHARRPAVLPPVHRLVRRNRHSVTDYDLGGRRYLATGEVLPDSVLDELRGFDAILLGAVGTPDVPPGVLERGLLLKLRFELDLYVNLRPFVSPASVGAGTPVNMAVV